MKTAIKRGMNLKAHPSLLEVDGVQTYFAATTPATSTVNILKKTWLAALPSLPPRWL